MAHSNIFLAALAISLVTADELRLGLEGGKPLQPQLDTLRMDYTLYRRPGIKSYLNINSC